MEAHCYQGLQHKKEKTTDKKHNVSVSCLCGVYLGEVVQFFSQNGNNNTMFLAIISAVASEPGATSMIVHALTELAATATRTQLLSGKLHWIFWLKTWCYHRRQIALPHLPDTWTRRLFVCFFAFCH